MLRGKWRDMAWVLPLLFILLILLPLAWSPQEAQGDVKLRPFWFLFSTWAVGIALAALISRNFVRKSEDLSNVDD